MKLDRQQVAELERRLQDAIADCLGDLPGDPQLHHFMAKAASAVYEAAAHRLPPPRE